MSKVLDITYYDEYPDNGTYFGTTECCHEFVGRSRNSCDEECPKCGKLLDWYGEDDD